MNKKEIERTMEKTMERITANTKELNSLFQAITKDTEKFNEDDRGIIEKTMRRMMKGKVTHTTNIDIANIKKSAEKIFCEAVRTQQLYKENIELINEYLSDIDMLTLSWLQRPQRFLTKREMKKCEKKNVKSLRAALQIAEISLFYMNLDILLGYRECPCCIQRVSVTRSF